MIWVDLHTLELHVNTFFGHRQFSALDDLDRLFGLIAGVLLDVLNLLNDVVALEDLAEDDVPAVQPAVLGGAIVSRRDCKLVGWSTYPVMAVVMKNCEPLVSLPALAMERRPFLECLSLKFSSGNLSP